jgi:CheY-like chemotaxis protein
MRKPKIMIVDGHANDHVYELIVAHLRDVVDVAIFDDTSLALRAARYGTFDLLVIGYDLPEVDVSEFLSQVRRLPGQEMVHVSLRDGRSRQPNNERSWVDGVTPMKRSLHLELSVQDLIRLTALLK